MIHLIATVVFATVGPDLPPRLVIRGTQVQDDRGRPFVIRGVNVPSLEWVATGENVSRTIPVMVDRWRANFIRLPLSQDRWFGKAPDSTDDGSSYRLRVADAVNQATSRGACVLLDLHWSNMGEWGKHIGQHSMPDQNSAEFWKSVAQTFANKRGVSFDLYNEPIRPSWEVWRDGGTVSENADGTTVTYQTPGMQGLVNLIRSTGAKNLIVAGGIGYASQLDWVAEHPLKDPSGDGILYANHFYPGWETIPSWEARMVKASAKLPLLIGEFGASYVMNPLDEPSRRVAQVLTILEKRKWNWLAWCAHPSAHPALITDWSYKPTSYFGAYVKDALARKTIKIPPRRRFTSDRALYVDSLRNGFQSWSSASVDLNNPTSPRLGEKCIKVIAEPGQSLQLGAMPWDGLPYTALVLWVKGAADQDQKLVLRAKVMDAPHKPYVLPRTEGEWRKVVVSTQDLGIDKSDSVKSFEIRNEGSNPIEFYLDEIRLVGRKAAGSH